jgi:hypothetical protein
MSSKFDDFLYYSSYSFQSCLFPSLSLNQFLHATFFISASLAVLSFCQSASFYLFLADDLPHILSPVFTDVFLNSLHSPYIDPVSYSGIFIFVSFWSSSVPSRFFI